MLLDSASQYYRAFYGVPDTMKAPDGTPINAVRGFLDMTSRLIESRRPDSLVACLDADWRPAFRAKALPSYKAHRLAPGSKVEEDTPPKLIPQVPILMEALDLIGLTKVGAPGFEADDVIATLAAAATGPVEVVTGDRDLFQVVRDEPSVRVLYTARGLARLEVIGPDEVQAKYGIPAGAYADFALLRGDPSDGLPGVPGIGEKTAARLLNQYGDLDGLLAASKDSAANSPLGARVRDRFADSAAYLAVAPLVVRVRTDVPLPDLDPTLPTDAPDPTALAKFAARWGLDSSVERMRKALAASRS